MKAASSAAAYLKNSRSVVAKPVIVPFDGVVTSVELFDAQGETIAMLFGKRKPGIPELPEWRTLVDGLSRDAPV